MSKRVEVRMPGDRTAAVQAFVDQGKQDEAPAAAGTGHRTPAGRAGGKATRLNVDLPQELHRRFKTACAAEGVKMGEIVTQLVQEWADKHR